ncbi:MAG TPA: radical SAM protein [Vicinamibacterales bacterium]
MTGLAASGPALLRVTGGVWGNDAVPPVLSVTVNGRPAGATAVSADVGNCLFQIESSDELEIELTLDRTFFVPGDERALGMMVRAVDVLTAEQLEQSIDAEGWFEWEHHEYFPFRWMGLTSRMLLPAPLRARGRFAQVPLSGDCPDGEQVLTVLGGDDVLATLPVLRGWHVYDVSLVPEGCAKEQIPPESLTLTFRLNTLWPVDRHPDDPRALGIRVGPLEVHDDRHRHQYVKLFHAAATSRGVAGEAGDVLSAAGLVRGVPREAAEASPYRGLPIDGDGWFWVEFDDNGPFRWMRSEGQLRITDQVRQGNRYCVLPIFSSFRNLTQEVTILADGRPLRTIALLKAWNSYSVELPPPTGQDLILTLRLNKIPPVVSHDRDPRPLGVRLSDISFHDDPARHDRAWFMAANAAKNQQELRDGATTLSSFPLMLGIDLYGKCNIKPACVYCLWDPMKALEGEHVNAVIDDRTLENYGDFFRGPKQLVNCSFGEPLLHPRFEQVLEFMTSHGKMAEISSNGQAFNARTVRALEGKPVYLYVSLDSATPETYARLRNDHWHEIVTGLLFLRDARRRGHGWPRLNLVFMPMRANRQDVEMYFKLCELVEADQLVLRPLLYLEAPDIQRDRGGYHFDYEQELLDREELARIFTECGVYAKQYEVRVISQFDFGKIEAPAIGEGRVHG